MSHPTDFIVLRGGLIEMQPDDLTVFNMDALDAYDDVNPEHVEDVRNLRDQIAETLASLSVSHSDHGYLTGLLTECDNWLTRHVTTGICRHCDTDIRLDDNGAGGFVWVHDFDSTVCGDNPPGRLEGDNLTVATPKD